MAIYIWGNNSTNILKPLSFTMLKGWKSVAIIVSKVMSRSFFLCDELSYKVSFLKYEVNDFMLILDRLLPLLLLLEHIEERSFSVPSCLFDYEGMKTFQMICQVTSIPTGFIIISTCKTSSKLFIVGLLEIFPHH